jgi:hypothetical protein
LEIWRQRPLGVPPLGSLLQVHGWLALCIIEKAAEARDSAGESIGIVCWALAGGLREEIGLVVRDGGLVLIATGGS